LPSGVSLGFWVSLRMSGTDDEDGLGSSEDA